MHVSVTLERQRATMERKESNYVYVILCIHIDPGLMGTSSCDGVSIYIQIEIGSVLEKNTENFCSSLVLNMVNLKGQERESTCSHLCGE